MIDCDMVFDMDIIVRIERLILLSDERLGPYAFEALCFRTDGNEDPQLLPKSGLEQS